MIVDIFGSLKENLNKKVRNPFFGTLSIVFVVQNWQLFYSLLFFDKGEGRLLRIEILEAYITNYGGSLCMLAKAVVYSFIVLLASYILINISALISNFFDATVHPLVVKFATKGQKVVTKAEYERLAKKYERLEVNIKEEREKRYIAEERADSCEKECNVLKNQKQNTDLNPDHTDEANNEELEQPSLHYDRDFDSFTRKSREEKVVDRILDNKEWNTDFSTLVKHTNNYVLFPNTLFSSLNKSLIDYLLTQQFLERNDSEMYSISSFGKRVIDIFLEETA